MKPEKKLNKKYLKIYARFFRRAGTVLLIAAYAISILALTFYGSINFSSKKYVSYYKTMVNKYSFYEKTTEALKKELGALDLPDGITSEGIYQELDIDEYRIYAGKYLLYICKKAFNSPDTVFGAEYSTTSLDTYLSKTENPALVKAEIISCIANSARFLPEEKYHRAFSSTSDIIEKRTDGRFILSDLYNVIEGSAFRFFDALLIAGILLFLIYKLNSKHLKRSLYLTGLAAMLGALAVLIPSIQIYSSLMKFSTVTGASFARDLLAIAHARTANAILIIAVVIFVISLAAFAASVAQYAPHHAKFHHTHRK